MRLVKKVLKELKRLFLGKVPKKSKSSARDRKLSKRLTDVETSVRELISQLQAIKAPGIDASCKDDLEIEIAELQDTIKSHEYRLVLLQFFCDNGKWPGKLPGMKLEDKAPAKSN